MTDDMCQPPVRCDACHWADRLESATTPAEVDGAAMKARENLRQVVEASVAKSGSGAVLVSACTVADLFADYATLARQLAKSERDCAELRALLTAQNAAIARTDALARQLAEANERMRELEAQRDVTLGLCKVCGKAEVELDGPCADPRLVAVADTLRDKAAEVRASGMRFGLNSLHEAADALIEARRAVLYVMRTTK